MTEKNELVMNEATVYEVETGEIAAGEIVVQETNDYKIVKLSNGKFKKNMKYHAFASRTPQTEEEEMELFKVFNENSDLVTQFKSMVGREITMAHVFIKPYESFNEDTGTVSSMVNTTIQDVDGTYYATSSKTVYYDLQSIMEAFGSPTDVDYVPLKLKVVGTKRDKGVQISVTYAGKANQK